MPFNSMEKEKIEDIYTKLNIAKSFSNPGYSKANGKVGVKEEAERPQKTTS